ncbi:MAG: hypothetical protein Q9174_001242 [Haloplaca sp. 1 TL-2023]
MLLLYGFRTVTEPNEDATQHATFHETSKWLIFGLRYDFATPQYVQGRLLTMLQDGTALGEQGPAEGHPMRLYPMFRLQIIFDNKNVWFGALNARQLFYDWARNLPPQWPMTPEAQRIRPGMTIEERIAEQNLQTGARARMELLGFPALANQIFGEQ